MNTINHWHVFTVFLAIYWPIKAILYVGKFLRFEVAGNKKEILLGIKYYKSGRGTIYVNCFCKML